MKVNGMRNWRFTSGSPIDENLTGCLQRYVVPGYGRKRKHLYFEYKQQGVANDSYGV
jgi:hypothetical protein